MRVADLIEELEKLDPESHVTVHARTPNGWHETTLELVAPKGSSAVLVVGVEPLFAPSFASDDEWEDWTEDQAARLYAECRERYGIDAEAIQREQIERECSWLSSGDPGETMLEAVARVARSDAARRSTRKGAPTAGRKPPKRRAAEGPERAQGSPGGRGGQVGLALLPGGLAGTPGAAGDGRLGPRGAEGLPEGGHLAAELSHEGPLLR